METFLLTSLVFALVAASLSAALVTAVSHLCVHWTIRSARKPLSVESPGVSILKPLKGVDDGLEENLRSLVEQRYDGPFEVILGAADVDDPALDVAMKLRREYPHVCIKLVAGREGEGLNPKVRMLDVLSDVASHDLILISDSNVRVSSSYLRDMTAELSDPDVGLVSSLIAGSGEDSVAAGLENLHLNSFVCGAVCGAEVLASHPCVVGKSMLLRRTDLDALGGWDLVRDVLGEDYLLGVAFSRAGHKVTLSQHVIHTINTRWGVRRFASRHLRWAQMRRWISPKAYAFEPLLNPIPLAAAAVGIGTLGGDAAGSWSALWLGAAGVVVSVKPASDAMLTRRLRGHWPGVADVLFVPGKDLLVLALWGLGWVLRDVNWRGNLLRIGPGSRLSIPPRGAALPHAVGVRGDRR